MTLKDQILARKSKRPELVPCPVKAWGKVYLRAMNAAERDDYEADQFARGKAGTALKNFRARFVAAVLVDADGERVFTDDEAAQLGELSAGEVRKVFEAAIKLNEIDAKDEAELTKNS